MEVYGLGRKDRDILSREKMYQFCKNQEEVGECATYISMRGNISQREHTCWEKAMICSRNKRKNGSDTV